MINYYVRYQTFEHPGHVCTDPAKPAETWAFAKSRRNAMFANPELRRCWVERIDQRQDGDLVIELSKERWGEVLAREEPVAAASYTPG